MVPSEEMRRNNAGALKATFPCNLGLNDKTLASCARCGIPGMITEAYQDECKEGSTFALTPTSCASFNPEEGGGEALASEIDFITMDGYGFDYVMVFAAETPGMMTPIATKVIRKIIAAGLRVRVHFSNSEEEIFCEIRAPVERLMRFADQVDRKLLLDRDQLERAAEAGDPEATIAPLRINDDSSLSLLSPYEYIYARYDKSPKLQILYQRGEGMWHPFRSSLRLGLTMGILEATTRLGGAGLKPDRMRVDGQILALFPKHSIHEKGILGDKWLVLKRWPWNAPYDGIKDYFGERIGLYFHFLGHLTTWLIPLATMGLAAALVVYTTGDVEHPITLLLAFVAVLWAIAMMESWKRKEKRVALAWGTTNFEESEHTRPEYTGVMIHSPVDGSLITFYPPDKRAQRMRRATVIVVTMIAGVLSCIAAVYAFRWYMIHGAAGRWGRRWGEIITSLLNSVQIHILNMFYKTVAVALTGYENHRTVNEYEDSLVMKLFGFMFCNSYGSFFYLAFVGQPLMGIECERRCMDLLATNLTIVLGVQLVVGNTMQVLVPYVKYKLREHARRRTREPTGGRGGKDGGIGGLKTEHTQSEESYIMEAYDPVMGTLMDYAKLAVQFGYVTLFVAAFPLAPAFALANDHVKARSHAFRMLKQMRRPAPRGARDIGSWRGVFTALTCVSVVTNSALVCFAYEDLIGALSLPTRLWLFVLFQWAGSLAMIAVRAMVPEVPSEVKLQLKRAAFLSKKMINRVSDKEDDTKRHLDEDLVMGAAAISPPASPTRMSPQASGRHIV